MFGCVLTTENKRIWMNECSCIKFEHFHALINGFITAQTAFCHCTFSIYHCTFCVSLRSKKCPAERIHCSILMCYYLPVNVRCLRDSLSVTDSGSHSETPFEATYVDFCLTKFRQNFHWRHLKENDMLKILAACHSGAPFQSGALRTCVPCLMVNPALSIKHINYSWKHVHSQCILTPL